MMSEGANTEEQGKGEPLPSGSVSSLTSGR
jgi:hypothetical protein